jgi:hypothetical protein
VKEVKEVHEKKGGKEDEEENKGTWGKRGEGCERGEVL